MKMEIRRVVKKRREGGDSEKLRGQTTNAQDLLNAVGMPASQLVGHLASSSSSKKANSQQPLNDA